MKTQSSSRLHTLDIFRAISIIWIAIHHFPAGKGIFFLGSFGKSGVYATDLFFVLSGYLISIQIFSSVNLSAKKQLSVFYIKRIFKTWPSYFFVLYLYFSLPVLKEFKTMAPLLNLLTFTQNFSLTTGAFSVSWSICVEEHFYLLYPLLAIPLIRTCNHRWLFFILLLLIPFGIFIRSTLWETDLANRDLDTLLYKRIIYYPTWTRLDGILGGCLVAYFHHYQLPLWEKLKNNHSYLILLVSLLLLISSGFLEVQGYTQASVTYRFLLTSLGFSGLCIFALMKEHFFTRFHLPGALYFSTITYSIYLIHRQAFHVAKLTLNYFDISNLSIPGILFSFAMMILFAFILHNAVERPFMNLRRSILYKM